MSMQKASCCLVTFALHRPHTNPHTASKSFSGYSTFDLDVLTFQFDQRDQRGALGQDKKETKAQLNCNVEHFLDSFCWIDRNDR